MISGMGLSEGKAYREEKKYRLWGRLLLGLVAFGLTLPVSAFADLYFQSGRTTITDLQKSQQFRVMGEVSAPRVWILQKNSGAWNFSEQQALRAAGIEILRYIPNDAYIVRGSQDQVEAWQKRDESTYSAAEYQGNVKLSPSLPMVSVFNADAGQVILLKLFPKVSGFAVAERLKKQDPSLRVIAAEGDALLVRANLRTVYWAAQDEDVEYVQTPEKFESMDFKILDEETNPGNPMAGDYTDLTGGETGTLLMGFSEAWAKGYTGKGYRAAMADTGFDQGSVSNIHPDFVGGVAIGTAFGTGSKSWEDTNGHGTHVAGSVLSRGTHSAGRAKGGAYEAQLVAQGLWSPLIDNLTIPPKIETLFENAKANGAYVHTNSWGSPQNLGAYENFASKVDEYVWNNPDVLVLFAAGNSGVDKNKDGKIDEGSVSSPGTAKNILTVGASENVEEKGGIQRQIKELRSAKDIWPAEPIWSSRLSDHASGIAVFSSRGPTRDGRLKPEIVAPGTNILSAQSQNPAAGKLWGAYNQYYSWSGGTSMATPLAAGAAVLTRQVLVEKQKIAKPSAALVKATMLNTAKDLFPGQYGEGAPTQEIVSRPDMNQGFGRVDLAAVTDLGENTLFVDEAEGVAQGAEKVYEVKVNSGLRVNLVWTDAPGAPSAAKALVNNLSLKVQGPNGQFVENVDEVNNNRWAEINSAAPGVYRIIVKGEKIPIGKNGKQPFALVATAK